MWHHDSMRTRIQHARNQITVRRTYTHNSLRGRATDCLKLRQNRCLSAAAMLKVKK
jgi:hypothetical protein